MARKTAKSKARSRSKSTARRGSGRPRRQPDALALLKSDHDEVMKLFTQFISRHERMSTDEKQALADKICGELKVHASIEEEIFYPAVGDHVDKTEELLHEAKVEHESAKTLISEIEHSDPDDELYDARVSVLCEYVKHHVKEEQNELFPMVRKAKDLDLHELAERLMTRKQELMREHGMSGQRERMMEHHAGTRMG